MVRATAGQVQANAEFDPATGLPSAVRVEARDLVFENGLHIDALEIDWRDVEAIPG